MAMFLVSDGADVNMKLQHRNYSSVLAAAAASFLYSLDDMKIKIVELLVSKGADVNIQLHSADGEFGSVEYLIRNVKADVNQQVRHGKLGIALAAAAFLGRKECVQTLIKAGADINLWIQHGKFRTAAQATCAAELVWKTKREWGEGHYIWRRRGCRSRIVQFIQRMRVVQKGQEAPASNWPDKAQPSPNCDEQADDLCSAGELKLGSWIKQETFYSCNNKSDSQTNAKGLLGVELPAKIYRSSTCSQARVNDQQVGIAAIVMKLLGGNPDG
ncbi:hypothetical protein F4680DRAFT_468708 [Xylaria scruposa]|nr:hypothetical protein F4680DRAFT_468708 [Xylaria scruposa]